MKNYQENIPTDLSEVQAETQENPKKKKRILVKVIAIIILLLLLLLGACVGCSNGNGEDLEIGGVTIPGFNLDLADGQEEGQAETKSQEEIEAELNAIMEQGMMTISMKTTVYVTDGVMELGIYNDESNYYPQIIELYLYDENDEAGEMIYQTGLIEVGNRLETVSFDTDLPAGTYKALAYFHAVDSETGAGMGTAGANISLIIS